MMGIATWKKIALAKLRRLRTGTADRPEMPVSGWRALAQRIDGYRFGLRALLVSASLSLGFVGVVALSPVWQQHISVSIAIFVSLILLPVYSAYLIRQLTKAMKQSEEASAAKGRLLARLHHELHLPLNAILNAAKLLAANQRLTPEHSSLLDVIRDSVQVTHRQIDSALDFSNAKIDKRVVEKIDFDLYELLNRSIRLVRTVALGKDLRLMLRIDPAIPFQIVGDPHRLQDVLIKLLSNAIKYTDSGYVSLEANLIRENERFVWLSLAVHDTGVGIEAKILDRISVTPFREDTSAQQLTELMGGRLEVNSQKGAGTAFSAEIRFTRQPPKTDALPRLAGMRILLVSEVPELRARIAALAQALEVSINIIASVADAVGWLGRGIRMGNPIHAVLVDNSAAFAGHGAHRGDDFLKKAELSFTPVFLIGDISPEDTEIRRWGYAGVLPYDIPPPLFFNTLHSSGLYNPKTEHGVVYVEPWAWGQPNPQRPRLLVADDNRTNLLIMRKILESVGYAVDTAEDGQQAIDMLRGNRYKAAIVDMHMPGLDGVAVIKQYRSRRGAAHLPIVMLTANTTVDAKLESADAGADAYLTKPTTAATIIGTLKSLLDHSEIHQLSQNRPSVSATPSLPVINTEVIAELDRLYNDPASVSQIVDEFEHECRRLLDELVRAASKKDHAAFSDCTHALKSNCANVGAVQLIQICGDMEAYGVLNFHREREELLRRLDAKIIETTQALREFTSTGNSASAGNTDSF